MNPNNRRKQNKRKNNRRNKRQRIVVRSTNSRLYKNINVMRSISNVICTANISIVAVNGVPDFTFSTGNVYYNLSNLSGLSDFTDQTDSYYFYKLNGITIDLERTADETTIQSAMNGTSLYLAFYPQLKSTNQVYADLSKLQSAYRIDTLTFDPQKLVLTLPNVDLLTTAGGVDYWYNYKNNFVTSQCANMPGQLSLAYNNTTNHGATALSIFNLVIKYHVTFAFRL